MQEGLIKSKSQMNPDQSNLKPKNEFLRTEDKQSQLNQKPSIFTRTTYQLPSQKDIQEFKNYPNLSVEDIVNGFAYTMIGRGMKNNQNSEQIKNGIQMLINKFPDNKTYKDALILAKNKY